MYMPFTSADWFLTHTFACTYDTGPVKSLLFMVLFVSFVVLLVPLMSYLHRYFVGMVFEHVLKIR
jgi:hypothetical protein